ncbi:MAG: MFS transporter [Gammaproteobacteria bacterium]
MRDSSSDTARADTRRLLALFALAYFAQALSQLGGLIGQPLAYYLKQGVGLNAADVADYLAILSLPWMIKPVYGLISDYLPLFGYRRRTWLFVVNLCAAAGFLWVANVADVGTLLIALFLTAFGTAAADVIIDAVMVEAGNRTGATGRFLGVQWMGFKSGAIVTALAGGYLASMSEPATGLHIAASITLVAPLAVLIVSYLFVREMPSRIDVEQMRATTRSLWQALRTPALRVAAVFLALWCFSPAFGTPLYYHMTDRLGFAQSFIGQLNALAAGGAIVGAWSYARYLAPQPLARTAVISIVAAVLGVLAYLALAHPSPRAGIIAVPVSIAVGMTAQIGMLMILAVAAAACPPRVEGFVFAALMSLYNGVEQLSAVIGARLYEHVFDRALAPLLWVAAASLMLCLLLVPSFNRLEKQNPAPAGSSSKRAADMRRREAS